MSLGRQGDRTSDGALNHRGFGGSRALAAALADTYTVYFYDRRGRGDSGNTLPWTETKEIDGLAAVLDAAGGTAYLAGTSSGAVKTFLQSVGAPGIMVAIMPVLPFFKKLTAVAPTLPYDLRILGDTGQGRPLDRQRWNQLGAPVLVMDGGKSPQYVRNAAQALAGTLPKAAYRTLPGQTHIVKAAALAPAIKEFLSA